MDDTKRLARGSRLREKKLVDRNVAISLGLICTVLAVGLVVVVADYAMMMSDRDTTISLQNSQIARLQAQNKQVQSWLFGNQTYFSDQLWDEGGAHASEIAERDNVIADLNYTVLTLNSEISDLARVFLNVTANSATLSELSLDPSTWVNKTVCVEGNLSFLSLSIENLADGYKWNYRLISNGAFWLLWEPDWFPASSPSYDGVNAIIIGIVNQTIIYVSPSYQTAYYIDAERIVPL